MAEIFRVSDKYGSNLFRLLDADASKFGWDYRIEVVAGEGGEYREGTWQYSNECDPTYLPEYAAALREFADKLEQEAAKHE